MRGVRAIRLSYSAESPSRTMRTKTGGTKVKPSYVIHLRTQDIRFGRDADMPKRAECEWIGLHGAAELI